MFGSSLTGKEFVRFLPGRTVTLDNLFLTHNLIASVKLGSELLHKKYRTNYLVTENDSYVII